MCALLLDTRVGTYFFVSSISILMVGAPLRTSSDQQKKNVARTTQMYFMQNIMEDNDNVGKYGGKNAIACVRASVILPSTPTDHTPHLIPSSPTPTSSPHRKAPPSRKQRKYWIAMI